jgi:hypothetical protein
MVFDFPHMIATAIVIFAVLWVFDHTSAFSEMTKGRKTLVKFLALFIVIFILNLIWPYGSGV